MKVGRDHYKNIKDLPRDEFIAPGAPLCAGCGGMASLRLIHKAMGQNVVVVNAAGCMTLMAVYPYTPMQSSWLYTTMGSPSAGAQGICDALEVLGTKYGLPETERLQVLVLAGDGSTYDMGLSSTSAAIHRQLDYWYLCYDNEAYGNTGFQMSSGSPLASRTATSLAGSPQQKKDLFEIYNDLSITLESRQFNEIAGVYSDYFGAQSCARFGRIDYALQSLLYRDPGSQEVTVLSRQRRYNCGVNRTQ